MDFLSELRWRGMLHDLTPGTEDKLSKEMVCGYVGFDPSAPSLQLGNLVPIILLMHFQRAGHKPIALVGGATGMVGDPSGKSQERNLLSIEEIRYNQERFKKQLCKFLDFDSHVNNAEIVNNYDWFKDFRVLDFLREVGKHLTVSYMLAKDSVQLRLQSGISFTEFSYQLIQAYDFYWLYKNKNCHLQFGGSDQWGNITAGTEIIRKMLNSEAFAVTCKLLTTSDGVKFGKSSAGERIWLDPTMTSPFKFYQFWLNSSDEDAQKFIKIFTLLPREEIDSIIIQHNNAPHLRYLQKKLANEVTTLVHCKDECKRAVLASDVLFGNAPINSLSAMSDTVINEVFEGVPRHRISINFSRSNSISVIELLTQLAPVFKSKGELRRLVANNGLAVNKEKVTKEDLGINSDHFLNGRYLLIQKGKKNFYLIENH